MKKLLISTSLIFLLSAIDALKAQNRKFVGAAELNGNFGFFSSGNPKSLINEILNTE